MESLSRLVRLVRKELVEILRDRRTILTLVVMPLLLYPLLSVAFQQFFLASSIDPTRGLVYRFGFATEQDAAVFASFLEFGKLLLDHRKPPTSARGPTTDGPKLVEVITADLDKAVLNGDVDVAVRLKNAGKFHLPMKRDVVLEADLTFANGNPPALGALALVERRLAAVHERNLELRLNLPKVEPKVGLVHVTRTVLDTGKDDSMNSLHALVPLILILMTMTGAVYPAIDLTAGERERGTLEILVAAPVPRLGLLFAKYVSVFTVAVLTALVNLVTMMLTLVFSGLSHLLFAGDGLSPLLVLELFGLLLLFAAFFSAVLLSLTSYARSFKEAQAYLIPLMLASLGPGLIGMMPGLELEGPLAVAPLINIVLLARDLVKGVADPAWALVVTLTTLAYAGAAIAVAARIFGAENVLYNEQGSWSDLWRRPSSAQPVATIPGALWCLVLMIPAHFALRWVVKILVPLLPGYGAYVAMGILGLVLFGVLPAVSAYLGRVRLGTGFGLAAAHPLAFLGSVFLGLSVWPMVLQLLNVLLHDKLEQLQQTLGPQLEALKRGRETMLPVLVVSFAIQGVLEEWFFRGYLFGALRGRLSSAATVVACAISFGLLHVLMDSPLGFERFLPSTLMGLLLGWVRATSGSVLPAMLLHACHNALVNVSPTLLHLNMGQDVPWTWLVAGAVGTCVGAVLVWLGGRPVPGSVSKEDGTF